MDLPLSEVRDNRDLPLSKVISNRDLPLREVRDNRDLPLRVDRSSSGTERDLPTDIQYIIASYVVPPVYRLADRYTNNIHWDELCYNRHPGMITLIDAYFERCLTIQSHIDPYMLERLSSNPTALPLLEKYKYHLIKSNIVVDWNSLYKNMNPSLRPEGVGSFVNTSLERLDTLLYQNPAIFEVDSVSTKNALTKFITEIFK
jgi:hypothetical protein